MANSWFQFKQFRVEQALCPLKVGTDACILGAWATHPAPDRILDIGTGTGLLALMAAQRFIAAVDALEPEPAAAQQAAQNFGNSPWATRLQLLPTSVQEFYPPYLYNLILCNPPFYPNHLKATDASRNRALHQETLRFEELASACTRLLTATGLCYILLPPRQAQEFRAIAEEQGLYVQHRLLVQEKPTTAIHRTVYCFGHIAPPTIAEHQLCIRDQEGNYAADYRCLLKDFYLAF